MDNVPSMVLDPDAVLASMLRGRTYLYIQECKIQGNYGFGISFEITDSYYPLTVPVIASMLDVSITVRETHFTNNTLGNMGKIPAHWIAHKNNEKESKSLITKIRSINPDLFVDAPPPAVAPVTHFDDMSPVTHDREHFDHIIEDSEMEDEDEDDDIDVDDEDIEDNDVLILSVSERPL